MSEFRVGHPLKARLARSTYLLLAGAAMPAAAVAQPDPPQPTAATASDSPKATPVANNAADPATQSADAADTSDIIVTATRQNSSVQRVPLAITAVGAKQLAQEGITSAQQLNQLSPSLYVLGAVSEGSPRFTLRGLTFTDTQASGSPAVATYVDDVYQAFQFGISTSLNRAGFAGGHWM